jgi:hypothetical protein
MCSSGGMCFGLDRLVIACRKSRMACSPCQSFHDSKESALGLPIIEQHKVTRIHKDIVQYIKANGLSFPCLLSQTHSDISIINLHPFLICISSYRRRSRRQRHSGLAFGLIPTHPRLILGTFRADYSVPTVAGVVFRHSCGQVRGFFTQILLVDDAILTNKKSHDS